MAQVSFQGCTLAYDLRGEGPPVLLIQGVGVAASGWRPQVETLAPHYSCLAFDHRGLGRSQPPAKAITIEQLAHDSLAVLDAAGFESAHVVGHSMGGIIAEQVALLARGRVRSLSLLCTFACGGSAAPLTPRMLWWGLGTRIGSRPMRRRAFLNLLLAPEAAAAADLERMAAELEPIFGHDLAVQPPIAGDQLKAVRNCDLRPRLGQLAGLPTLVLAAAHDPIAPPAAGRQLAAAIPGARYVQFADASHGLPITHAEQVNDLLAAHFATSERTAERAARQ